MLARAVPVLGALTLFVWAGWFRSWAVERGEGLPASGFRRGLLLAAVGATAAFALYALAAGVQAALR